MDQFPRGSFLYTPSPRFNLEGAVFPFANLVADDIRDSISSRKRPLTVSPCVTDTRNVQKPDLSGITLPGFLCFKHKTRIIGLYSGGRRMACEIFHPAGACIMRNEDDGHTEFSPSAGTSSWASSTPSATPRSTAITRKSTPTSNRARDGKADHLARDSRPLLAGTRLHVLRGFSSRDVIDDLRLRWTGRPTTTRLKRPRSSSSRSSRRRRRRHLGERRHRHLGQHEDRRSRRRSARRRGFPQGQEQLDDEIQAPPRSRPTTRRSSESTST